MADLSEGAQLLRASGSLTATATRLHCAARSVSAWRGGTVPSRRARERIELVLGIPREAWDRAAGAVLPQLPAPDEGDRASSLVRLRAQHARVTASIESGTLTPRGRIEHERLALAIARAIEKIERPRSSHGKPHARTMALSLARRCREAADRIDAERTTSPAALADARTA